MEPGQKTASYEGTQLLRGSGSALTAMGTWPASIRREVGIALPLLNRLDTLHSAAVAAQGHHATCLGIKSSTVTSSFPHLYLLHAANDNVVIYGSQQCWQAWRGGRRPAKAWQTSYSMPGLGRIPSPLPVDRWKSPGLATAGACGSLEVTAGWKKCTFWTHCCVSSHDTDAEAHSRTCLECA